MSRYFFHIYDGRDRPDPDGVELPDMQAVRTEAIRAAGEMLRDIDGALTGEEWMMSVVDEAGQLLLTLRFSVIEHT